MTCIKTGARVLLEAYGWVVPADIHMVGDCFVVRFNENCPFDAFAEDEATHVLKQGVGQYWKKSEGLVVVPSSALLPVNVSAR